MKNTKKVMIIFLFVLIGSFMIYFNYAANTTNAANTNNVQANSTTDAKTNEKSSNANLSDLGIKPHDFTGFRYGTTSYEVNVPFETESVEVYAKAQDSKAKLTGTGKLSLEPGKNTASVVVTAEDGTKKTYTISIIRDIETEQGTTSNTEKETEKEEGLTSLKINEATLSPEFKANVYEYTANYTGDKQKLTIETTPKVRTHKVEVTGNENLKEGENLITILVSDQEGNNVATYQITVTKTAQTQVASNINDQNQDQQMIFLMGGIGIIVILTIIGFIVVRRKRNRRFAEEFSGVPFYGMNQEDDGEEYDEYEEEEVEEETPRAFRKRGVEEDPFSDMSKDKIKEQFLNNYHKNHLEENDEEEEDDQKRKPKKGKRFK